MFSKRKHASASPLVGWRRETLEQVIRALEMQVIRVLERHASEGGATHERVGWYADVWRDRAALLDMLAEIDKAQANELRP